MPTAKVGLCPADNGQPVHALQVEPDKVFAADGFVFATLEDLAAISRLPEVLAQLPGELPLVIDHMAKPEAISADDTTGAGIDRPCPVRQNSVHLKLSGA